MNKRQTVWLIVRLIGVYFGYLAIVSLLSLVGAIYNYASLPSANTPAGKQQQTIQVNGISIPTTAPKTNSVTTPGTESPADKIKSDAMKEALWLFFLTVIYGGIGFYLIRNGKPLFSTLIREELTDETEEITYSASANSTEKAVTSLDLSPGSSNKKEEVTSLNLSEYVPKTKESAPPIQEKIEDITPAFDEQKSMNEKPETEPVLADKETSRMDYALETDALKNEEIAPVQNEALNQPFFADETPTLIKQTDLSEPPKPRKRQPKIEENTANENIAPNDVQPNENFAPSDVSADAPSEEKK